MLKGRKHSIMLLVETPRNASNESRAEVVQASGPGRSSQEETPEKDPPEEDPSHLLFQQMYPSKMDTVPFLIIFLNHRGNEER